MPEATHRLRVKRIDRVGFVDQGDDPKADIVFFKRMDVGKKIIERDGKFLVTNEDETKVLGTHDTRGQAEAQLAAAETKKRAETFGEVGVQDRINSEISKLTHDLARALMSTVNDADAGQDQSELIDTSLDQFMSVVRARKAMWLAGKPVEKMDEKRSILSKLLGAMGFGDSQVEQVDKLLAEGADGGSKETDGADTGGNMSFDIAKADEETRAAFEDLTTQLATATEALEKATAKDGDGEEDVLKGVSPEVRKLIEAEREKNEATETKLQKLIDDGENERFIAKAMKWGLPPDDFAGNLRKVHEALGDEEFDKLEERFRALGKQADEGGIYGVIGSGGDADPVSVKAEVDEAVKELQKSTPGLSTELARGQVMKNRPELRQALVDAERVKTQHLHSED